MDVNGKKCNNKRAFNFSSKEENILISLVKEKYVSQIESKKTDTNANRLKTETWIKLAKEFNSYSGDSYRDAQVLRNKYLNMKKRSKKNFSEEKKYLYGTGGGLSKSYTTTDIDNSIKEILGSQVTGLSSEFDNDQENMEVERDEVLLIVENNDENASYVEIGTIAKPAQKVYSENVENFANTTHADVAGFDTTKSSVDWSNYTPQKLRTPVSSELKTSNKCRRDNTLKTKLGTWAQSKQDLLTVQQKSHIEEHLMKLKHLEEKHQTSLKHDQECHNEKIKMNREEHEIKLQILHLQRDKLLKEI